ncbi:hypothetical protein HYR99_02135 [Candidatus Poribacteria bacterium]|nr:hypothetical protein [Candidatus Poribacteria bacterium]
MERIENKIAELIDVKQQQMGEVTIERHEGNLILGTFVPCPAFSATEQIFQDFEEAVEVQALNVVDELDAQIAELGLHLRFPDGKRIKIHDVQIYSDGGMSFRLCSV